MNGPTVFIYVVVFALTIATTMHIRDIERKMKTFNDRLENIEYAKD